MEAARRHGVREPCVRSALLRSGGNDCLAKTRDFSAGGIGLETRMQPPSVGSLVEVAVVFPPGVLRFRGRVRNVAAGRRGWRCGVRLLVAGAHPPPSPRVGAGGRERRDATCPVRSPLPPVRVNLGLHFDLLTAWGQRRMERDRRILRLALAEAGIEDPGNWSAGLLQLLRAQPRSNYRNLAELALFREQMLSQYPSLPGSVIQGRVYRRSKPEAVEPVAGAIVAVDCFCVATADDAGSFVAEGLPVPTGTVLLQVEVHSTRYASSRPIMMQLSAGRTARYLVDVAVTPVHPAEGGGADLGTLIDELP